MTPGIVKALTATERSRFLASPSTNGRARWRRSISMARLEMETLDELAKHTRCGAIESFGDSCAP